ncbi:MAG TPA: hypothetical protein PLV42_04145 [bacterium]|nr:hypothetical protein [bacterium]
MKKETGIRLSSVELAHFRFFSAREKLIFDGKNVLVYGENGSGKSSLYKALELLSQPEVTTASLKKQRNVHATSDDILSITYNLDNGETITFSEDEILPIPPYAESLQIVVPFLDYKKLLRLHFATTGSETPLDIMPVLLKLLGKYPFGTKTVDDIDKWSEKSATLKNVLNKELLPDINAVIEKFGKDFSITEFAIDEVEAKNSAQFPHPYFAYIKATYLGNDTPLPFNQFFNEARLSAIALAIYFAAIKKLASTRGDNFLKILVLDDLLISLDMSNRLVVKKLIFEYFSEFQILFFTHDRALFELLRYETEDNKWRYIEMYIAGTTLPKPTIFPSKDYFQKARQHFDAHDYPACANYLRKEYERLEKICRKKREGEKTAKLIKEIKRLKDYILNPHSHDDISKPLYKGELEETLQLIGQLKDELDPPKKHGTDTSSSPAIAMEMGRSRYDERPYQNHFIQFEKDIETDFREEKKKKPDAGYFQLTMFPVEQKKLYSSLAAIKDTFRPIAGHNFAQFPRFSSNGYFSDRAWHSFFIKDEKTVLSHTSVFEDGLVLTRETYWDDMNKSKEGEKKIQFPEIITFVTQSLMLGKQLYKNWAQPDEEFAFKFTMTDLLQRDLIPPQPNRNFNMGHERTMSRISESEVRKIFFYHELDNYLEISKEIIDQFFYVFQWGDNRSVIDKYQKDFLNYFNE